MNSTSQPAILNAELPSRSRSPSVTVEEIEEIDVGKHRTGPPQRNPNAILEEVNQTVETGAPMEPPLRSWSPSVTIEEIEEIDMGKHRVSALSMIDVSVVDRENMKTGPPQQNPNAILEEVNYVNGIEAPSPGRYPSVSVEEIGDEDAPEVPHWGPHPFAQPTRKTLFPEPHPDPTAGAAFRFYEVDREAPPKYTSVLAEPDVFKEAYWLDNLPISRADEAAFFNLPRNEQWYWRDLKEFKQEVNRLPRGPSWFRESIKVIGDEGQEILDLWKRHVVDMIRYLLSDPHFIPHTRFAPDQHYDSEARHNRVYGEMWSGKWWWRMQVSIKPIGIQNETHAGNRTF
ncbi:hypothetical protein RhiJN_02491 [Ceratobasidium sp. AG-Ba]|nr:hypothetical protein RhiJN_02491 [Ceratobasidium sp. AG-Ba]QRW03419.1 hypothetical protein RhiLY_02418 [Ceratobasidium sp. AG-Ba]